MSSACLSSPWGTTSFFSANEPLAATAAASAFAPSTPITLLFLALTVLSAGWPFLSRAIQRRRAAQNI